MATKNVFGIWNNKGGVGKSTITYHLSTRYAELHPEEEELVDMVDLDDSQDASDAM